MGLIRVPGKEVRPSPRTEPELLFGATAPTCPHSSKEQVVSLCSVMLSESKVGEEGLRLIEGRTMGVQSI